MAQPVRFRSLDSLRGLSILGMAWSGMLPDSLPAWMYHAQIPPPNHYDSPDVYGITWVDLVFPFFLFSMGAAIPLAITNRLSKGDSIWSILKWLAGRAVLLVGFSIFGEHLRPGEWSSNPDRETYVVAVAGFVMLLLMFGRWPAWMPSKWAKVLAFLGWVAAALTISLHIYPDGHRGFENFRNDIIIMVLANVAFSAGAIWMMTRKSPLIRMAMMASVAFVFINQSAPHSLAKQIWDFTPLQYFDLAHWPYTRFLPIFYHFEYHKYLMIVLPGTICGDIILSCSREDFPKGSWTGSKWLMIGILCAIVSPTALYGLLSRAVLVTSWTLTGLTSLLIWMTTSPLGAVELLVSRMLRYGGGFLILGLLAEPLGGGVRKDPTTLSYFLISAGLAFFALSVLEIVVDILKDKSLAKFLWLTGMNPILAYTAITNLIMGVSGLTGFTDRLNSGILLETPWLLALFDGGSKTLLVGLIAAIMTEQKFFLRT